MTDKDTQETPLGKKPAERVEAIGAEVVEIVDGKIKEIRYHKEIKADAADRVAAMAR